MWIVRAIESSFKHSQLSAIFPRLHGDTPGSHLCFLADLWFMFLCVFQWVCLHHTSCVRFLCWNPCSVPFVASLLCVFPPPSLYSLLLTAVSHSPGTSLLWRCISLSVSEGSHCHPQHAINIALADSYVVVMEVRRQHQHLILVACVFASASRDAEIVHINICLILPVRFQHQSLHCFLRWSFRWAELTEPLADKEWVGSWLFLLQLWCLSDLSVSWLSS